MVIGCGNLLAGDDGAGAEVVRRLEAQGEGGGEFRVMPQAGVELLEIFDNADAILFVDAVVSGAPPGTLHLAPLPWPGLEARAASSLSSHGWGLGETLEVARAIGRHVPRLMLLGVEVETVSLDIPRSAAVERAIATVVEGFPRLHSLLSHTEATVWSSPRRFLPGDVTFPG